MIDRILQWLQDTADSLRGIERYASIDVDDEHVVIVHTHTRRGVTHVDHIETHEIEEES